MKKIIITLLLIAGLTFSVAGPAQAADSFTGSTFLSYGTFASIVVQTSSNVYMIYVGATSAQTYGAFTKNKAGDKYYATGGGQGSSPGIYYKQSDTYVSDLSFTGMTTDELFSTTAGDGWTAQ